jgi:hypothetical protein
MCRSEHFQKGLCCDEGVVVHANDERDLSQPFTQVRGATILSIAKMTCRAYLWLLIALDLLLPASGKRTNASPRIPVKDSQRADGHINICTSCVRPKAVQRLADPARLPRQNGRSSVARSQDGAAVQVALQLNCCLMPSETEARSLGHVQLQRGKRGTLDVTIVPEEAMLAFVRADGPNNTQCLPPNALSLTAKTAILKRTIPTKWTPPAARRPSRSARVPCAGLRLWNSGCSRCVLQKPCRLQTVCRGCWRLVLRIEVGVDFETMVPARLKHTSFEVQRLKKYCRFGCR